MNVDEAIEEARQFGEQEPKDMLFAEHIAIELAAEVERLRAEVEMGNSFHRVAVKERDFERLLVETLKEELAAAKAASVCPVEMQNEQDGEQIAIKGMSHFYGDLWILHDVDEYFWLLDNYNGGDWQPITKQLYDALLDYNKRAKEADKTPPEA